MQSITVMRKINMDAELNRKGWLIFKYILSEI